MISTAFRKEGGCLVVMNVRVAIIKANMKLIYVET